jgi:Tfp pilus assembly protein PilO
MPAPKLSLDKVTDFFNSRNPREKAALVIFGVCFLIAADILLIIQPVASSFFSAQPELRTAQEELKEMELDKKNEQAIEAQWKSLKESAEAINSRFVASSEISAETLSKLAQESGIKIASITPADKSKNDALAASYAQVPIRLNMTAGTHGLGRFLAKIENSVLFFRINSLSIIENIDDPRNHNIEISVECYRKI